MSKRKGTEWRQLAHRRNGLLGRLTSARNMCRSARHFEGLSKVDRAKVHEIRVQLEDILSSWDKHYIKKLRERHSK